MTEEENRNLIARTPPAGSAGPSGAGREYGLGVLKGAIAAIPWIGSLMNEMIFEARSRLKQERLAKMVSQMAEQMRSLDETRIDRHFVQSQEFSDLVEEVFLRAARTRSEAKRECLKNTLVKAIFGLRPPSFSTLFLNLVDEISEEELQVYRNLIARNERSIKEAHDIEPIDYEHPPIDGLRPLQYKQVVQSLVRKGLAFDDSSRRLSTPPFKFIKATELGIAFLDWIAGPGESFGKDG